MRRTAFPLSLIVVVFAVSSVQAQSANKIIDRHKKASGGDAVKRVKSTLMSGTIKTGEQTAGRFVYQTSSPDRLRIDIEAGELKLSESYNGKSAWRMDSRGLRTLLGDDARRLRLEAILANTRLRDLARYRILPQVAAKDTVEGREVNVIEFTKDDVRSKLFFDASTNLLVKQEREMGEGKQEVFYSDHRAVDGVMEPFSIRIKEGARDLLIAIDRLEHNRSVEETAFRYPQVEGARPLPDLEALMKSVIANQEKLEELRERYTFRETEIQRKLDGSGRVKETETRVYEVTPVAGQFVQRLISVNGKELTEQEKEKEDREVQKKVKDILEYQEKQKQKKEKKEQERQARGGSEEENPHENRSVSILSFLKLTKITSVRREMFRGHEVIAFDFEPIKGIKTKNRTESLVSKLAGTMWVDENAQQIVRLEARLTDTFKFAGGLLASVSPSTAVALEQEKVGDEVWLPSYAEANISARVMLLAKFNRNVLTRYSDYKKYKIDSKYEMEKPKEAGKPEDKQR